MPKDPNFCMRYRCDISTYICIKIQPTATPTSHVIAIHVVEANMSVKLHNYAIHTISLRDICVMHIAH